MNKVHLNSIGKKLLVLVLFIAFTGMVFAIEVTITPPKFSATGLYGPYVQELNDEFVRVFKDLESELKGDLGDIDVNPKELIGAFGNASVFSSDGATQRGYRGYNIFAVTVGAMVGFQLPVSPFKIMDEFDNLSNKLQDEADIKLGLDAQLLNVQVGINSSFLIKNLYLGFKFGYMNLGLTEELTFKTSSFGVLGNYQWQPRRKIAAGMLLWRGVNLGAGLIYQKTDLGFEMALDTIGGDYAPIDFYGNTITTELTPKINMGLSMNTVTVPLEAVTSVRLLYFLNAALGFGIDLGFGSSKLEASAAAELKFTGLPPEVEQIQDASITAKMGGENGPSFFNPKVITGLGFSLGPVIIDIPVTFYLGNSGYNAGLTVGVVW
ncbi:MAG: hypothetical protein LBH43_10370 [Treponema sp.]|jgi:hypothetical protein|nr:hypothetical protein [Treponema sp.]